MKWNARIDALDRRQAIAALAVGAVTSIGGIVAQAMPLGDKSATILRLSELGARQGPNADASQALRRALTLAAKNGATIEIDGWYSVSGTFHVPAGIRIKGNGVTKSGLFHRGAGDFLMARGPIDLDGFAIDGCRGSDDRLNAAPPGHLLGIVGPPGGYMEGVRIGHIRLQNSSRKGAALVNLADVVVDTLEFDSVWARAVILSGIKNGRIKRIVGDDIGRLGSEKARDGVLCGIYAETDIKKAKSDWYISAEISPTNQLSIGSIDGRRVTDTAVYVHDYLQNPVGVTNVTIDNINIDGAKDAVKVREGASQIKIGSIIAKNVGLSGFAMDGKASHVQVDTISVANTGYDFVGDILGHPSIQKIRGNGRGTSIQSIPAGIRILSGCHNVTISKFDVRASRQRSFGKPAYGLGIWFEDSSNIVASGTTFDTDGEGARLVNCTNVDLDVQVERSCQTSGHAALVINQQKDQRSTGIKVALTFVGGEGGNIVPLSARGVVIGEARIHVPKSKAAFSTAKNVKRSPLPLGLRVTYF